MKLAQAKRDAEECFFHIAEDDADIAAGFLATGKQPEHVRGPPLMDKSREFHYRPLRKLQMWKEIPVFFYSARAFTQEMEAAIQVGGERVLGNAKRPVDSARLRLVVD